MNSRISIYVLVEDKRHQMFIRGLLKKVGVGRREMIFAPIPDGHGSGKQSVLSQFPDQVRLCRRRNSRASTSLIAMLDADELTVERCLGDLDEKLLSTGQNRIDGARDRIARVIPKRNIETWITYLTLDRAAGTGFDEDRDIKGTKSKREWENLTPSAVEKFVEWNRLPANRPANLPDSLSRTFQEIPRALPTGR